MALAEIVLLFHILDQRIACVVCFRVVFWDSVGHYLVMQQIVTRAALFSITIKTGVEVQTASWRM